MSRNCGIRRRSKGRTSAGSVTAYYQKTSSSKEHGQVPAAESRLDGWVPPLSGAARRGPCASKEHAHDLAAPRGFAGVPQSFGAARRGPCAFEIHAELPHTRRLIDATGDLLAHPLQAVRTKEIG